MTLDVGPCFVCGAVSPTAPCAVCGWPAPGLPGTSPEEHERWVERLTAAEARWDVRAARLAAGPPGDRDDALLERLLAHTVRGAPATEASQRPEPGGDPAPTRIAVDDGHFDALADLVSGAARGAIVVVYGPDGVTRAQVRTDPLGTPTVTDRASLDWTEIVPGLADDADLRLFQLAGGRAFGAALDLAAVQARMEASALGSFGTVSDLVVELCGVPGWDVAERASVLIPRDPDRSVARIVPRSATADPSSLVERLLRRAPLRQPYALVVASVAEDGTVGLAALDLFAEGAVTPQSRTVEVTTSAAAPREILLPIVALRGTEPETWRLVATGRAAVQAGARVTITVELGGPGQVGVVRPTAQRDERSWTDIRGLIAAHATERVQPVDLVCAVELSGPADELAGRRAFLRTLIAHFRRLRPGEEGLRVGLLGYHDHPLPPVDDDPVVECPLGSATAALDAIQAWEPRLAVNDLGAPVEDALARLPQLGWRPGSAHALLVVGVRPPHPDVQGKDPGFNRCPWRHDWKAALREARSSQDLRCVAVRGALGGAAPRWTATASVERGRTAWRELGDGDWLELATDPTEIAKRIGLADTLAPTAIPLALRR